MTYDLICISKACSMTFRKNQRFPAAPCETACGRAGLRYAHKQAAVYAGLRCVRRQCAQAGGCICRLAASASSRHRRPSPAESAAEFAGLCARKLGRGAQACIHTNSKSRRSVSPPSCRGAQTCVHTNAALGARLRQAATVRAYSVRNQALSMSPQSASQACGGAKGGAVSQTCIHKRTLSLSKQTAARAGGGRIRRYRSSPAMIWTKLRIYERTGDCIRRLGYANGCRPQCATAADEPPRRFTDV